MSAFTLSLVVVRSRNVEELKDNYEKLGLVFQREQHGKGPVHYSCALGDIVLELYPSGGEGFGPTMNRLGFQVENLREVVEQARSRGVIIADEPKVTQWGQMAVVRDCEGRIIELIQK